MKKPVAWWKSTLVSLTGVMVCVLLLFAACDDPVGSDGASDDVGSPEGEDAEDDSIVALYTITYLGNGAVSGEPPVDTGEYERYQTIRIASQGALRGEQIRDGITQCVTHWTTGEDGSGDEYIPGTTAYMPERDLTLHAQWSTDSEVIGKTGPSGGWIFYEDTAGDHNWDYLEAAPEDIVIEGREAWQWGAEQSDWDGFLPVDDGIGGGLTASGDIVAFHDSLLSTDGSASSYYEYTGDYGATDGFTDGNVAGPGYYTFNTNNDGTVAAKLCTEYTVVSGGTTYEDWFLPSEAELTAMYDNLWDRPHPRGAFEQPEGYWSTKGYNPERARAKWFDDTGGEIAAPKSSSYRVRPVRSFAGAPE
jgi:hypothetical protein